MKKIIFLFCFLGIINFAFATNNPEGIQIYQNQLRFIPYHKQKLADDLNRYQTADNLWDVLRDEFSLQHEEENPQVQQKIQWFMNNQTFLVHSAERAAPYLYYILQQIRKRHLPAELVLLPIIESSYNPFSLSNKGAAGIWQLMPNTAADLGIKQNWWYDGRRDVIASTRAALNYLSYLQSFFEGNWLYAIAAYNTGIGNVTFAIKRNIQNGIDTDFWSLPVAQATKDYVPSLFALAIIISHPEKYPIYFPPIRNAPYLAQINIGTQINLKYAANLAGIDYKSLLQLNPAFNQPTTQGPHKLILPIVNVEQFADNLIKAPLKLNADWLHYKVQNHETLLSIAKKFGMSPAEIKQFNHLALNTIHSGMVLFIPVQNHDAIDDEDNVNDRPKIFTSQNKNEDNIYLASLEKNKVQHSNLSLAERITSKYILQPGDTIYMVRNNDTVTNIAKKFNITIASIIAANQLTSTSIQPGQQLVIPNHSINQEIEVHHKTSLQPGDTIYMVRRGDSIDKIAERFHTSSAAIRLANLVDENSLIEGEKIIVPTHMPV